MNPAESQSGARSAAAVVQPDGSSGLLVATSLQHPAAPGRALAADYAEQEATAVRELQRMRKQDEVALAASNLQANKELERMMSHEDAVFAAGARDCPVYHTPAADDAVSAASAATDVPLQHIIAAHAAGPHPLLPDPSLMPTRGMTWLERMAAEDARLKAALESTDAPLKPPGF